MHLGGAIDQAGLPRVAIDPFEDRVLGIAAGTIELDRDVGRAMQGVGHVHLGHGDFLSRVIALVKLPGGMHHQQPPDLDLMRDLAEVDLHALAVGEPHSKAFALSDVGLRDLHRALGQPEPAHAVGEPRGPEPDLGDPQSVADLHQHVLVGHFEPLEDQFAVSAVLLRPHDGNAAQDAPARLVTVIEEGGEATPRVLRRARHQDEVIGDAGPGDEPLVAVNDPAIAFLLRVGADHAGIGAAPRRGLSHGERGAHPALDDGLEPFVLLRWRSHPGEQVHIAVVGRRAIEGKRTEDRAIGLLVHRGPGHDRQPHAAVLFRRLRRPQAFGLGFGLHGAQHVEADVLVIVITVVIRFERQHMLLYEAARAHTDVLDFGGEGKVHASVLRFGG